MKHSYALIILLLTATSCQLFETEKISTQTFYEEEIQTINWNDIDQYPAFSQCEDLSEKKEQKECFKNTLTASLFDAANRSILATSRAINDTIFLGFSISEDAKLTVTSIEIDSTVLSVVPFLKEALLNRIDSLQLNAPAYKRGIPVKTEFTLPIVITTEDL